MQQRHRDRTTYLWPRECAPCPYSGRPTLPTKSAPLLILPRLPHHMSLTPLHKPQQQAAPAMCTTGTSRNTTAAHRPHTCTLQSGSISPGAATPTPIAAPVARTCLIPRPPPPSPSSHPPQPHRPAPWWSDTASRLIPSPPSPSPCPLPPQLSPLHPCRPAIHPPQSVALACCSSFIPSPPSPSPSLPPPQPPPAPYPTSPLPPPSGPAAPAPPAA